MLQSTVKIGVHVTLHHPAGGSARGEPAVPAGWTFRELTRPDGRVEHRLWKDAEYGRLEPAVLDALTLTEDARFGTNVRVDKIDVMVLFRDASFSHVLPEDVTRRLSAAGVGLSVSVYATDDS